MAGAEISIELDDDDLVQVLGKVVDALSARELRAALQSVGEAGRLQTDEHFEAQAAPDGTPWAPLKPRSQRRKKRNADKVLIEYGDLRDSIAFAVGDGEVSWGTSKIYGAAHQFGREDIDLVAREFLGLSDDDREEIIEILFDHFGAPLRT